MYHREATESVKYISNFFVLFCFSFLWCCGFVLLGKCSATELFVQPPDLKHILLSLFVCVCVDVHVEVRGQLLCVGSLLPPNGIRGLNSHLQASVQGPLSTDPSQRIPVHDCLNCMFIQQFSFLCCKSHRVTIKIPFAVCWDCSSGIELA